MLSDKAIAAAADDLRGRTGFVSVRSLSAHLKATKGVSPSYSRLQKILKEPQVEIPPAASSPKSRALKPEEPVGVGSDLTIERGFDDLRRASMQMSDALRTQAGFLAALDKRLETLEAVLRSAFSTPGVSDSAASAQIASLKIELKKAREAEISAAGVAMQLKRRLQQYEE